MDIPQLSLHSRKEAAKEQKDRSQEAANGTPGDIRAGWELGTGTKVVWRLLGIWVSTFMTWVRVPVSLKSNPRQGWEVETWSWWTGINSWRDGQQLKVYTALSEDLSLVHTGWLHLSLLSMGTVFTCINLHQCLKQCWIWYFTPSTWMMSETGGFLQVWG